MRPAEPRYDVALSFAGEQRAYVEQVARSLKDVGVKVFYDDYEKVSLWGKDLYTHLDYVYRQASRYCVVFISKDYATKVWTNHERARALKRTPWSRTRSMFSRCGSMTRRSQELGPRLGI
jgi:hypothetical protein